MAFLLAFSMPAPALAELVTATPAEDASSTSGQGSGGAATGSSKEGGEGSSGDEAGNTPADAPADAPAKDSRGITSAQDSDGNTWYYYTADSKNYLTGFKKAEPAPEPESYSISVSMCDSAGNKLADREGGLTLAADAIGKPYKLDAEIAVRQDAADDPEATVTYENVEQARAAGLEVAWSLAAETEGASIDATTGELTFTKAVEVTARVDVTLVGESVEGAAAIQWSGFATAVVKVEGALERPAGDNPEDGGESGSGAGTGSAAGGESGTGTPSDPEPEPEPEPDPIDLGILTIPDTVGTGADAVAIHGISASWSALAKDDSGNEIEDSETSSWGDFVQLTIAPGIREVADKAFVNCSNLQTVTFEAGSKVTSIGKKAFLNCTGLSAVTFAGTQLTSIGERAFANCAQLKTISLPQNSALKTIGPRAFSKCSRLSTIAQLETSSLQSVGANAFEYSGIASFKMPNSLKSIGRMAFLSCDKLTNVTISKGFAGAYELSDAGKVRSDTCYNPFCGAVNVRYSVPADGADNYQTANGGYALVSKGGTYLYAVSSQAIDASGTFSVKLDATNANGSPKAAGIALIAESAFAYNKALTSIDIPNTVIYVNKYAFMYSGVKRVSIPASVQYLRSECFSECASLASVTLAEGITKALSSGGKSQFANCTGLKSVTLPSTLAGLSEGCFKGTGLTGISIPANVTSIPRQAFATTAKSSPALTSVSGCAALTRIEAEAFAGQTGITSFTFGDKIAFISNTAFSEAVISLFPARLCEQADGYHRFETVIPIAGWESFERADRALARINKLRADAGLDALVVDEDLMAAAMKRAAELPVRFASMGENGAQASRPIGLPVTSVSPKATGEAIAIGHLDYISENSAISVVKDFMAQECWSSLFLGSSQSVGVGCYLHNGELFWSVLFGAKRDDGALADMSKLVDREASYDVYVNTASGFPALSAELSVDEAALSPEMEEPARVIVECLNGSKVANGVPDPAATFNFSIPAEQQRIATVDEKGAITVKQGGTVTVTATLKGTSRATSCTFTVPPQASMDAADITVSGLADATFTGAPITQKPVVTRNGAVLEEGFDYTVEYVNNTNAGVATCRITGMNNYEGAIEKTFTISKAAQSMTASAKKTSVPLKKVAKKKRTIASPVTVGNAIGTVSYANASTQKIAKKLKVKASSGKIVVPKCKKARTYKVKVLVSAAGSANFNSASKKVSFKIVVK